MNRDVKIGLAIGLLLLVGLFVWFAVKASRNNKSTETPVATNTGADTTTTGADKTGDVPGVGGDYFAGDCGTTGTYNLGKPGDTTKPGDVTPDGMGYLDGLKKPGVTAKPGDTTGPVAKPTTKPTTKPDTGTASNPPATYVVKDGDTLSTISRKVYGSARYWEKIADANNLGDGKGIRKGQTLKIPALAGDERAHVTAHHVTPAPAPTAEVSLPADGFIRHKVAKGDTLEGLSMKYFGDKKHIKAIMEANKLTNDKLRVGSTILIPKSSSTVTAHVVTPTPPAPLPLPATASVTPVEPPKSEYVVQEGDTLEKIAIKFFGTPRHYLAIMQANNLEDPRSLQIGTKLHIPAKPDTAAASGAFLPATTTTVSMDAGLVAGEKKYTVKEGETFAIIAAEQLGSSRYAEDVMKRNRMTEADTLRPGDVLILPAHTNLHSLTAVTRGR